MYYVVALGNPGEAYKNTRHNVGWQVVDSLITFFRLPELCISTYYMGRYTEGVIADQTVRFLCPDTFMNNSGKAINKFVSAGEIKQMIVIHDDIALPFGTFKISVGRGAGGHNGVQSIIDSVGHHDFTRLRLGIAPVSWLTGRPKKVPSDQLSQYVLGPLTKREQGLVDKLMPTLCEAVRVIVTSGASPAMNQYNTLFN